MFLSNFIETTLGSVTKETSQYTKSLKKEKKKSIDKKKKQNEKTKNETKREMRHIDVFPLDWRLYD